MPSCHVGLIKYQDGRADTRFTYEIATSFFRRLLGLRIPIGSDALLFPRCSCVHGFGVKKDIQVLFLSSEGRVLKVRNRLGAHSIASHPQASHVLEFSTPKSLVIGDQLMLSEGLTRRKPAGFSLVETDATNAAIILPDHTTLSSLIPEDADPLFARIKPIYADATISVSGSNLPTQSYLVRSEAENASTNATGREVRVVEVNRSLPAAPSILDYALYSGGSITKQ